MSHAHNITPPVPPTPHHQGNQFLPNSTPPAQKTAIDECLWSVQNPELQKACYLARVCAIRPPKSCQYRDVAGILQVGPTCGLTALSMLLAGAPPPEQLLSSAKELKYTNNGEIFSARYLLQLVRDHLMVTNNNDVDVASNSQNALECVMHEGRLNCAKVRNCLLDGDCIFVAYPLK